MEAWLVYAARAIEMAGGVMLERESQPPAA